MQPNFKTFPKAYVDYKQTMDQAKKDFPGLYPASKESKKTRQKLMDAAYDPKTIEKNCKTYNDAYQNLWDNWGFDKMEFGRYERGPKLVKDLLKTLDAEYLSEMKLIADAGYEENWSMMDRKMNLCASMLEELEKETAQEKGMLNDYKVDQIKSRLKEWKKKIWYDDDENKTWSGLPFDSKMMELVLADIKERKTKDWNDLTGDQKTERMNAIIQETWDTMYDKVIVHTQPDRTKAEFDALMKVYNSTLDPHDYTLSHINNTAKVLFMQTYWAGGEKLILEVDEQAKDLKAYLNESAPNYVLLWKAALELVPDLKMNGEISLFIKALDPHFLPSILDHVREAYACIQFMMTADKAIGAVHDSDYKMQSYWYTEAIKALGDVEEEKAQLREQMFDFPDLVDDIVYRQNAYAKNQRELDATYELQKKGEVWTIEDILMKYMQINFFLTENDPREKDIVAFHKELVKYLKTGKGDMQALENKAKSLLPSTLISKDKPIDDLEYMRTFVSFVRAQRTRMDGWSFRETLDAQTNKFQNKIDYKREVVTRHMRGRYHDVLHRTVKHLIEEDKVTKLEQILDHYGQLVKRHKGEVYGSVAAARALSDAEFEEIVAQLQKQNPGKKYFLNREVDPNIVAGFMIKCGANRIDYSLMTQTTDLRKQVGA